ncbi:MAG: peptidase M6 [Actinomycetota bacterium]
MDLRRLVRFIGPLALVSVLATLTPRASAEDGSHPSRWKQDIRSLSPLIQKKGLPYIDSDRLGTRGRTGAADEAAATRVRRARIGDVRWWPALDDTDIEQGWYMKKYKLRGKSEHMEIWVAVGRDDVSKGLWYPEGDCRNDYPDRIRVTDKKVRYFLRQFENTIYPRESELFSRPIKRNGAEPLFIEAVGEEEADRLGIGPNYFASRGGGRRVVTLVDNVRDDQFYDTDDSQDLTRIAGFFWGLYTFLFDRNIMTIDSWQWKYFTGPNPPTNPVPGNVCESVAGTPYGYESVFAHEYQHLLQFDADPDGETAWINEGLSMFVASFLGYSSPEQPITSSAHDSTVQCLLGWLQTQTDANPNPFDVGGPENSLTWWDDQAAVNSNETLCEYGATATFHQWVATHFGSAAMTSLHNDDADGLESVQNALGAGTTSEDAIHRWLGSIALDGVLDDGAVLTGGTAADYQVDDLDAIVDWTVADAYDTPGAPPNGADFVRARANNGDFLSAAQIDRIVFDGADELAPDPVEWTVQTPTGHTGGEALYSGDGDNLDRSIVREVSVPATNATLTFDTLYDTEWSWDYAFVQVSTDGGTTWTSLSNANTTSDSDPQADPRIKAQLPGLTGASGVDAEPQDPGSASWVTESFDLSGYAGQDVLLGFRYMTDAFVAYPGWWIDNVAVGGNAISDGSDLNQWQSMTEINPPDVHGFTVQLVAYDDAHTQAWIAELPLGAGFTADVSGQALDALIGTTADVVSILVTYDEPTEQILKYANYELRVDNALQPGG